MAYDTLKAEIRQYIKTNGANEITGQILQNVLLDMVNAYPSLDGYATQQWVQNQNYLTSEELSGYATKIWVEDHGYVTSVELSSYATHTWVQSQLNGYLPLTGGTLTGGLNISDGSHGYAQLFVDEDGLNIMTGSLTGTQQLYTGSIYSDGTIEATGNITGFSFIKAGGTSSQFLKADGSVDSNNYLALSGGTITGNLDVNGTLKIAINKSLSFGAHLEIFRLPTDMLVMKNDDQDIVLGSIGNNYYVDFIEDIQGGTANSDYSMNTVNWGITTAGAATFVSVTQTSDIRRKNIISNLELSIEDIAKAPLFKFTWKDKEDKTVHIGTSAQYWQGLMPELTSENKNGVLGLQYDVAAMAGVTTVAKVVVDHEQRIAELEKENALLKARLNIN